MKWLKHDSDAHADAKLIKLKMRYGLEGYGLYWHCLELISGNIDANNLTFELEHDAEIIAYQVNMHEEKVAQIMAYMVDLGLFENSHGTITCMKLALRLDQSMTNSPAIRHYIQGKRHDNVMTSSANVMKEEKRTEEKRKEKAICNFSGEKVTKRQRIIVPFQEIIDLYHLNLPTNPRIEKLDDTRKRYMKNLWVGDLPSLEHWENYFHFVSQSRFLTGKSEGKDGRKPFCPNLEWITKPANYKNIYEEKYHG